MTKAAGKVEELFAQLIRSTKMVTLKWGPAGTVGPLKEIFLAEDKGRVYHCGWGAPLYIYFLDPSDPFLKEISPLSFEDRAKGIFWVPERSPGRVLHIGGPFWQKERDLLMGAIQAQTKT